MPSWGGRGVRNVRRKATADQRGLGQGYHRDSETRQRSPMWFTPTYLHDCHTTSRSRGRWEQPSVVNWKRGLHRGWCKGERRADRETEEMTGGTFPKYRMTLPITMWREVEHVGSCSISPQLACRVAMTGTHPLPPPPHSSSRNSVKSDSCDSSFRVKSLSCPHFVSLTACGRLKELRDYTEHSSHYRRRTSYKVILLCLV